MNTRSEQPCECKVGRVSKKYGLEEMNSVLATRWRGENGESHSLRELETVFNRAVLRAALQQANVELLEGELENTYRLLVDDEVSSGSQTQARNRLERNGVDVETVLEDFVSHQSIHTHLRECLDAEKGYEKKDPIESARNTIFAMENRTEKLVENHVSRLGERPDEPFEIDGFDVFVDVTVACHSCGRHYDIGDLLESGGCNCQ